MSRHNILILSPDPFASALLAGAVELAGHCPHFAAPDEPARAALRRTRATAALVDCEHDEGCSDAFIGPALMLATRVLLIRSPRSRCDVDALAGRDEITVLELPAHAERLTELLDGL